MTKKIFLLAIFVVVFTLGANAKTLHLSNYSNGADTVDDTVAFQQAVEDLKQAGGGTLIVDDGTWYLSSMINMSTSQNYVSLRIQGTKGSVIQLSANAWVAGFYAGNVNQIEFVDLIITGKPGVQYDVSYLIYVLYTSQLKITGCQFMGLRAKQSLIYIGNVDAKIEDTLFHGVGADQAVIYGSSAVEGLTVENSQFYDYGNLRNTYQSKCGASAWIQVDGNHNAPVNGHQPYVRVSRSRFDEAARVGIKIANITDVMVANCYFNVSGTLNGTGIELTNVAHGLVEASGFGYPNSAHPALKLKDASNVRISRLKFGDAIYFADLDDSSNVRIEYCPECEVPNAVRRIPSQK